MARRNKHYEDIIGQGKDLIKFYLNSPCVAVYELLGVDLAPIQRVVFQDMWFKDYVIAICSRGYGKTFSLAATAVLSCMLKPGYRVGLISPSFRQSLVLSDCNNYTFWTDSGLVTGTNTFYNSVIENKTTVQSLTYQNKILSKWKNEDRDCIGIKTAKGYELAGTSDHAIVVLDELNGDTYFKDLCEIKLGEYVLLKTGFEYFANRVDLPDMSDYISNWKEKDCTIPKKLTSEVAYLMGLLVGDGCLSISKNSSKHRIMFTSSDPQLINKFSMYMKNIFGIDYTDANSTDRSPQIGYYCKKVVEFFLRCGLTKTNALDKKIPDVIKRSSKEHFLCFIRGLMDTGGTCYIQNHKGGSHCEVSLSTSSLTLAKEVQAFLMNVGIISNLSVGSKQGLKKLMHRDKYSVCNTGYKVRITGRRNIEKANNIGLFQLDRKRLKLANYTESHFNREDSLASSLGIRDSLLNSKNIDAYKDALSKGFYFVEVNSKEHFFAPTIDIEVENESCYWANGFINHNSKMIFAEVEKLYAQSSIFREACEKPPIRGTDNCYVKFKSVNSAPPSYIEALPLGNDGGKIRGSRFYLIVIDELAQIPDSILDLIVRPMGATSLAPMERVRRIEQQDKLISLGLATSDDFEKETVNKMIMTSSGYYKFNHVWRRMKDHWRQIDEAAVTNQECPYAVWQIPYWDLPSGFLDMNNINEAKRVMSSAEFRMEYEAEMISDSEGFFKASLLDQCSLDSGFHLERRGDSNSQYVMGVDPNQGGSASAGIVVIRVGASNRIVNVSELKKQTTQDLTKHVQELCRSFNIIRIFMDKGGGGKSVCDLLEEGYNNFDPIIDRTNEDHRHLPGRHILEMVNFNPTWIADANFTTKAYLESKQLLFPEPTVSSVSDMDAINYENVLVLKSQMLNIIVTQTSTGLLHFDTPTKGQNKDLYSALILAAQGAKMVEKEMGEEAEPILHNTGGMIRLHNSSTNFISLSDIGGVSNPVMPANFAVLKKKLK